MEGIFSVNPAETGILINFRPNPMLQVISLDTYPPFI